MARRPANPDLNVMLNGRLVGHLRHMASGAVYFQYAKTWLAWEHTMPISLSLPLREDQYSGAAVIAVFDNLLPDNKEIRERIAAKAKAAGTDAYHMLSAIGQDCVGALQFLHDDQLAQDHAQGLTAPLSTRQIENLISNLKATPLGIDPEEDEAFRISIAGMQEKTALTYSEGKWRKPLGTSPTTHIFKPQIGKLPNGIDMSQSVENEFLCLTLTAAWGLPSAKVEIADFGKQRVLIVERFDRRHTSDGRLLRLPQEDFCQALSVPPTQKYEVDGGPGIIDILTLLKGSNRPAEDQKQIIKSLLCFWLMAATDGHAKNFSIFLGPGNRFRLTPLYDVLSAQPYFDAGQIPKQNQMKLAMSVGKKKHWVINTIAPRHFVETANSADINTQVVHAALRELIDAYPKARDDTLTTLPKDFPQYLARSIFGGVEARLQIARAAMSGVA
jgi:serine/threonine-protein kinase HipA